MVLDFFWIGLGLAMLGYFIGDGLKNFKNPKASGTSYPTLIKEKDLHKYLRLSKEEVMELLDKYPDAPKIELRDTTYYPYQPFIEWLSAHRVYER